MIAKKMKRCLPLILAMLLACTGALAAQGAAGDGLADRVDFQDGNFGFLAVYATPPDADPVSLDLVTVNGANAVRASLTRGGNPYIVIDAGGLLGPALKDLAEMCVTVGVENPDGVFHAVSGEIVAYDGAQEAGAISAWSVYLADKNPNVARITLGDAISPGAADLFILSKKVDNAHEEGHAPSNLIIHAIDFYDAHGSLLPVDPTAVFDPPEGFDEADRSNLFAVSQETVIDGAQGESSGWAQAVALPTQKNDGPLDPALLSPGCIVSVYYIADTPPELILQSWTDGAPEQAGWAKVAPGAVNDSGTIAQFRYDDLAGAFGTDAFPTYLDQLYVGDTGGSLTVSLVTIGAGE